jgi:hypothetical protein
MLSTRSIDRNMESGTPQRPRKRVNDASQSQRATPAALTATPDAGNGLIEKSLFQKRRRRSLDPLEKLEVAAVRKRGACKECRRKKEKVCSSLF